MIRSEKSILENLRDITLIIRRNSAQKYDQQQNRTKDQTFLIPVREEQEDHQQKPSKNEIDGIAGGKKQNDHTQELHYLIAPVEEIKETQPIQYGIGSRRVLADASYKITRIQKILLVK